ncbi:hypothetical protein [Streptomyces sp. bgisy027]|uniref:hypothetical protein n=1 Tax=Streptomyces sp. bgisy027 TaxID=3413770 RepID=UPI003D739BD8
MSTARCRSRSRLTWLRVLVLLLALLVPGAHAQAHALPPVATAEIAEQDVLDTALRPVARAERRIFVWQRPGPPPEPATGTPAGTRRCAPSRPPYVPHIVRTVVLRC